MNDIACLVSGAIRKVGTRRVAEILGVSREAALSIGVGVATAGTMALVRPNLVRLEHLVDR
jgi:hypothetical protein